MFDGPSFEGHLQSVRAIATSLPQAPTEDGIVVPLTEVITHCIRTSLESQKGTLQAVHQRVVDVTLREREATSELEACKRREQQCLQREQECERREAHCSTREQSLARMTAQLNMFDLCLNRLSEHTNRSPTFPTPTPC
jgi:hypothetical protein